MATQIDPNKILIADDEPSTPEIQVTEEPNEAPPVVQEEAEENPLPSPAEVLGDLYVDSDLDTSPIEGDQQQVDLPPILEVTPKEGTTTDPADSLHWTLSTFSSGCLVCDALVQSADPDDIMAKGEKMPCHWSKGKYKKCPGKWMTIRFTGKIDKVVAKYSSFARADTDPMKRIQKMSALTKDLMECTRDEQAQILSQLGLMGEMQVKG